ncbi:MAG: hypothetical protein V3T70_02140, partial [Phycisphaerae bacterium]
MIVAGKNELQGNDSLGEPSAPSPRSAARFTAGLGLLLAALAACALLSAQHLSGLRLPGCGPASGCAQLSETAWGRVPVVNWPVAFVG